MLMVTVAPSFLALTTTPSMPPSSAELTWPMSAAPDWADAGSKLAPIRNPVPTMAEASNAFRVCMTFFLSSIQWLDLHDRSAVIAADPEGDGRGRIIDPHPPDVGAPRQLIFRRLARPGVEPDHAIARHARAP